MKLTITILVAAFGVALVSSLPVPEDRALGSQALDRLVMVEGDNEEALRSKRTIGVLRQLFPGISQMIEQKVNAITSEVIRILGPVILRGVLGNGGGGGGGGANVKSSEMGTTVDIEPPFGDDDDSSSSSDTDNRSDSKSQSGARVSISLPTYPPDEEDEAMESTMANKATTASSASSTTSTKSSNVNPEAEDRLTEETAESQNNEVRVQFADDQSSAAANEAVESELAPLEDIEVSDDENRNKRFLNFGFGASGGAGASAGSGGSGGGSGNFLFDIIRQAADGAARAAGTVYRVVAGTQSLGLGLSASRDVGPAAAPAAAPAASGPVAPAAPGAPAAAAPGAGPQPPLVAGSGSSQQGDVAAGAPSPGRNDGTTEAVPGPVTRLFVIANRGISNLIQDLILRLAATSERIVNFKARLITSII